MDVHLCRVRVFLFVISFIFASCGNRYGLDTEYGRRARIDDANLFISKGECSRALDAIRPLYDSGYRDEEVVLVTASANACLGGFQLLKLASNFTGATNFFSAMAKSMPNTLGDGKITAMYAAVDVLTSGNVSLNASIRSKDVNTYMVYLQMGIMGAILSAYGSPNATTGAQGANLVYSNPRNGGEMSNLDACALAAAMSAVSDSYPNSNLSDSGVSNATSALDSACNTAVGSNCSVINRNRTSCDGTAGGTSLVASQIVTAVNNAW